MQVIEAIDKLEHVAEDAEVIVSMPGAGEYDLIEFEYDPDLNRLVIVVR
jgi:hypothetical protein